MKKYTFALIATVVGLQAANTIGNSQAHGRRILEEASAAMGGEKFTAMKDLTAMGWTGSWHGTTTRHTRTRVYALFQESGPLERYAYNKDETSSVLFNRDGGFEITYRGARPLPKETVSRFREDSRNSVLHILQRRLNEPGLTAEFRGSEVCEKQAGDVVDILSANPEDPVVTVCFSQATRLPIRQSYFRRDPLTRQRIEEMTLYSRFIASSGVMWPRTILQTRDGLEVKEIFLDDVSINQGLAVEKFAIPSGTKIFKAD